MSSRQVRPEDLPASELGRLKAAIRELALQTKPSATADELDDLVEQSLRRALLCTR